MVVNETARARRDESGTVVAAMVEVEDDRECSVLSGLDPLALFAMYAEDEQLYMSTEEAGKLLADAFPLARAKGAEGKAFVKAQLTRAESQNGKIGVAAWMRFWPHLLEYANSLPAVSAVMMSKRPKGSRPGSPSVTSAITDYGTFAPTGECDAALEAG